MNSRKGTGGRAAGGAGTVLCALLTLAGCGGNQASKALTLTGTGGFFPLPLYGKWFHVYESKHPGVKVSYEPVGSGGGVRAFVEHSVDFGTADSAMSEDEIERVDPDLGAQLLPLTAGCIVLVYNLPEIPQLRLSRKAYAGIFLGRITRWSDPLIVKDNLGAKIPDMPLKLVVRSDASGVALALTKHLSTIDSSFFGRTGIGKMPDWVVGTRVRGSDGIMASVEATPGAIGYVAYSSAKDRKLPMALLENKSGTFVAASTASGRAALGSAPLPDDLIAWIPDPEAKDAYPIVTYTWILCYRRYERKKRDALVELLTYSLDDGQKDAEALGFIPLPPPVVQRVKEAVKTIGVIT